LSMSHVHVTRIHLIDKTLKSVGNLIRGLGHLVAKYKSNPSSSFLIIREIAFFCLCLSSSLVVFSHKSVLIVGNWCLNLLINAYNLRQWFHVRYRWVNWTSAHWILNCVLFVLRTISTKVFYRNFSSRIVISNTWVLIRSLKLWTQHIAILRKSLPGWPILSAIKFRIEIFVRLRNWNLIRLPSTLPYFL
jgi:hypothetical protein